ncbi:unnamed protein product, partial [Chrysoparadoxa australica]
PREASQFDLGSGRVRQRYFFSLLLLPPQLKPYALQQAVVAASPSTAPFLPSSHSIPSLAPLAGGAMHRAVVVALCLLGSASAFHQSPPRRCLRPLAARNTAANEAPSSLINPTGTALAGRRAVLKRAVASFTLAATLGKGNGATALIKGNAPPPTYNKKKEKKDERFKSMTEAEEFGQKKEDQMMSQTAEQAAFSRTKSGVRYRDITEGSGGKAVKEDSTVSIRYRVLKLGKRSYDGLSGEATLVFSYGYGEDDDKEGSSVKATLGQHQLVGAVEDAMVGMTVGGVRRVLVYPDRGWKKADPNCAGQIDLSAVAGIPSATLSKVEDCVESTLEPSPKSYAAQRRMARRFDEALLVEVELAGLS